MPVQQGVTARVYHSRTVSATKKPAQQAVAATVWLCSQVQAECSTAGSGSHNVGLPPGACRAAQLVAQPQRSSAGKCRQRNAQQAVANTSSSAVRCRQQSTAGSDSHSVALQTSAGRGKDSKQCWSLSVALQPGAGRVKHSWQRQPQQGIVQYGRTQHKYAKVATMMHSRGPLR